jgi:2-keto-4-pentenoate hydratase/2-oxohepta-3-ene-1,7-dioic acid hydratase in catechol pathway
MKIARYEHAGERRVGIVEGPGIRPLPPGTGVLATLSADRGDLASQGEDPVPLADVRLLAPLEPRSIRDFMVFEEHVEGAGKSFRAGGTVTPEWYTAPTFYFSNPEAVVGPGDDVPIPPGCEAFDFELEVAAIVGRTGGDISVEDARAYIAGYTILNDWSARDLQRRERAVGLGPTKAKDSATTLGPWIVTADELERFRGDDDRVHLELEAWINGGKFGDDTLANMSWSFEEMLAYASRGTRVVPGDVLGSGTCGAGCLLEAWGRHGRQEPPPLGPGDIVELVVEGIGRIRNTVVAGRSAAPVPLARPPRYLRARRW